MKVLVYGLFFLLFVCIIIIFLYNKRKRTVIIPDEESGNVIYNFYIGDEIVKSIMKNSQGIKVYEVKYRLGVVSLTKNYDEKGRIVILQSYYTNGQVDNRVEYRMVSGKYKKYKIKYDVNGNRIM